MTSASFENAILNKVPADAISYCVSIFEDHPFHFKISKNRKSKSGDYRYDKRANTSVVSVNSGLNIYAFLITLIHEIAHHTTRIKNAKSTQPHGMEWKGEFRDLMLPLVNPMIFPDDLIRPLAKHLKNPKASTWSDSKLSMALRKYDIVPADNNEHHLDDLEEGNTFSFNDRLFKRLNKRRTRVLCQECSTGRKYLIPQQAIVRKI